MVLQRAVGDNNPKVVGSLIEVTGQEAIINFAVDENICGLVSLIDAVIKGDKTILFAKILSCAQYENQARSF